MDTSKIGLQVGQPSQITEENNLISVKVCWFQHMHVSPYKSWLFR